MENEKERNLRLEREELLAENDRLRKERESWQREIARAKRDKEQFHLMELQGAVQRIASYAESAQGAISLSDQHWTAARAVVRFLRATCCGDTGCVCAAAVTWLRSPSASEGLTSSADQPSSRKQTAGMPTASPLTQVQVFEPVCCEFCGSRTHKARNCPCPDEYQ